MSNTVSSMVATSIAPTITVLALTFGGGTTATAVTLDALYQQELKVLQGEKKALERSLKEQAASTEVAKVALRDDLKKLTAQLAAKRAQNALAEQSLPEQERGYAADGQAQQLEQLTKQMSYWLSSRGVGTDAESASLPTLLAESLDHVATIGTVAYDPNVEYFGVEGAARRGGVLRLGRVAAFATDEAFAPLAIGEGQILRQVSVEGKSREVSSRRLVTAFLVDPKSAEQLSLPQKFDLVDWLDRGGVVMWAIALLAAFALVLAFERGVDLLRSLLSVLSISKPRNEGTQAVSSIESVIVAPVLVLRNANGGALSALEDRAATAMMRTQARLTRGLSFLGLVAAVAPLMGLLGTVTGMIGTFAVITQHGTGDPKLLSGGISEALLTTQFGLMVAIPALLLQTAFYRSAHSISSRLEQLAEAELTRLETVTSPILTEEASDNDA